MIDGVSGILPQHNESVGSSPKCGPVYGSPAIHFNRGPGSDDFHDEFPN
jgi:hypothetical protein